MQKFNEVKVFVSGGAGVIGSVLVERLHRAGAKLLVGDLKPRPDHWPEDILYWHGDLNTITKEELHTFGPEIFFHLAATFERTAETPEFWDETYHHNIQLSHLLIDHLRDCPTLSRVIFASSYLIYDSSQYLSSEQQEKAYALREDCLIYPRNLCGMAKLNHEQELKFIQDTTEITTVNARIFRVYGRNSRDIISRWIRALKNDESIHVYRPEGRFDYIFADDAAEGLLRLARTDFTGTVNLGTGNARSVSEVLNVLRGHFPEMQVVEDQSDIPYETSVADMERFREVTGSVPDISLEDGIERLVL